MTTNWFNVPAEPDPEPQVWTLADIYADLGTSTDIAKHLNITKARLKHWITRAKFDSSPKPVCKFGSLNVYSKQEWADWYAKFMEGKRPGTTWTDNSKGFKETRANKLDPNFKFGNPGINNALIDWREGRRRAAQAEREADAAAD